MQSIATNKYFKLKLCFENVLTLLLRSVVVYKYNKSIMLLDHTIIKYHTINVVVAHYEHKKIMLLEKCYWFLLYFITSIINNKLILYGNFLKF